ncbi:MAG: hypothetical protein KF729_05655 [Sandaracinaceae bacterium]|nr:hypothetical protein [Sandaracinaceae bacterium]
MKALVTGGYFDDCGDGIVWLVDLASGRSDVLLRWQPPAHLRLPAKGLAGASLHDDTLYAAAHAAIVRIDLARANVTGVLHQPCMNDLHHVSVLGERLVVSNTGLGSVDVFGLDGVFVGSHALIPGWTTAWRMSGSEPPDRWAGVLDAGWTGSAPTAWPAAAGDAYYSCDLAAPFHQRKVRDHLHVNHVTSDGDRMIATCFADGSLREIGKFELLWRRPGAFVHDGVVDGASFWLTAIDGAVIELDATTFSVRSQLQVFDTGRRGWCRGLAVRGDHLLVGLTEVRRERLPRHRWADHDPDGSETSVLLLDRHDGRLLARVELTDRERHSKLYSIIPLEDSA